MPPPSAAARPTVFLVGDMPYMSYQPSNEIAVRNAGRFMAEAGCDAIKLEGGAAMAPRIKAIVDAGIPAIGHLGLTPQSVAALGGFRVQGKSAALAKKIADDAKALEKAGAFAILLELVPDRLCKLITERAENCIIMGLGSGPHAHGQLLIYHDMFGLYPEVQAENGEGLWQRRRGHPERVEALSRRGHDKTFPRPRTGSACRTKNSTIC